MAINFPSAPVNGQLFVSGNVVYSYIAAKTAWVVVSVAYSALPYKNMYVLRNFGGTANAQTAETGDSLVTIPQYSLFKGKPILSNTGAMWISIDGTGLLPLKSPSGAVLAADEWDIGRYYEIIAYDQPLTEYRITLGF